MESGFVSGLSGVKVAVIGLGASGVAAARLALKQEGEVYVSDLRTDAQTTARGAQLRSLGAVVDMGGHDLERVAEADLVVASPGIPPSLIAITGTNGKTTTSMLTAHLLETAGHRVALGGNVGGGMAPPASELALLEPVPEWYVLELSSFQLAGVDTLRPDIGVVTNLSPDHLDRYESLDAYYADKRHIFDNADEASRWVLPAGDPSVNHLAGEASGGRYYFGGTRAAGSHAFLEDGMLTLASAGQTESVLAEEALPLLGRHNRLNALTAALTARLTGVSAEELAEGLRTAKPLPHRLEPIVELNGVLWVNDSKATNVAATRSALESLERPVVLLAGGTDKGEDFSSLRGSLAGVRAVVLFGAAAERMADQLEGSAPIVMAGGQFTDVVGAARRLACPGDIALLSPACSSFDMFTDYEDRGRRFAALARGSV
jgi:UDP-N-acetylmuramoylalanine--D-glutamate ligase